MTMASYTGMFDVAYIYGELVYREREREWKREKERKCVCVCVYIIYVSEWVREQEEEIR